MTTSLFLGILCSRMDKEKSTIIPNIVFSLFYIAFGVLASPIAIKDIFFHIDAVRNERLVTGTVQDMSYRIVRVRRSSKRIYTITFSYDYEGQEYRGTFETERSFIDAIGNHFETRYRLGNKMPILLVSDGSVIVYREKKKVLANDSFIILFCAAILLIGLSELYRQIDVLWEQKEQKASQSRQE